MISGSLSVICRTWREVHFRSSCSRQLVSMIPKQHGIMLWFFWHFVVYCFILVTFLLPPFVCFHAHFAPHLFSTRCVFTSFLLTLRWFVCLSTVLVYTTLPRWVLTASLCPLSFLLVISYFCNLARSFTKACFCFQSPYLHLDSSQFCYVTHDKPTRIFTEWLQFGYVEALKLLG